MEIKGISWIGLGAGDYTEAVHFFSQTLGLKINDETKGKEIALLSAASGQHLQIFGPRTAHPFTSACPIVAFAVEDIQKAYDELLTKGVDVLGEITSNHGFDQFFFRGPNGHIFAVQTAEEEPAPPESDN